MSAVQIDTLKINHCVNRAAPVSIYRDWPASLDDKCGSFVAAQVNDLVCTSELGE